MGRGDDENDTWSRSFIQRTPSPDDDSDLDEEVGLNGPAYFMENDPMSELDLSRREDLAIVRPTPFTLAKLRAQSTPAKGDAQRKKDGSAMGSSIRTALDTNEQPASSSKTTTFALKRNWAASGGWTNHRGEPVPNAAPSKKSKRGISEQVFDRPFKAPKSTASKTTAKGAAAKGKGKKKDDDGKVEFHRLPSNLTDTSAFPIVAGFERQRRLPTKPPGAAKKRKTKTTGAAPPKPTLQQSKLDLDTLVSCTRGSTKKTTARPATVSSSPEPDLSTALKAYALKNPQPKRTLWRPRPPRTTSFKTAPRNDVASRPVNGRSESPFAPSLAPLDDRIDYESAPPEGKSPSLQSDKALPRRERATPPCATSPFNQNAHTDVSPPTSGAFNRDSGVPGNSMGTAADEQHRSSSPIIVDDSRISARPSPPPQGDSSRPSKHLIDTVHRPRPRRPHLAPDIISPAAQGSSNVAEANVFALESMVEDGQYGNELATYEEQPSASSYAHAPPVRDGFVHRGIEQHALGQQMPYDYDGQLANLQGHAPRYNGPHYEHGGFGLGGAYPSQDHPSEHSQHYAPLQEHHPRHGYAPDHSEHHLRHGYAPDHSERSGFIPSSPPSQHSQPSLSSRSYNGQRITPLAAYTKDRERQRGSRSRYDQLSEPVQEVWSTLPKPKRYTLLPKPTAPPRQSANFRLPSSLYGHPKVTPQPTTQSSGEPPLLAGAVKVTTWAPTPLSSTLHQRSEPSPQRGYAPPHMRALENAAQSTPAPRRHEQAYPTPQSIPRSMHHKSREAAKGNDDDWAASWTLSTKQPSRSSHL